MLRADPIFFRSLARGKGARRAAFSVENPGDEPVARRLVALHRCPDWLTLERVLPGGATEALEFGDGERVPEAERRRHPAWLVVPPRRRVQLVAVVDTDHRFFPRAELPEGSDVLQNEAGAVVLELSDGDRVEVPLAIAEVVLGRAPFDGVFALDLGTTSSCWAWKRRRAGPDDLLRPPSCSGEVPSLVWFKDLRLREAPKVAVGHAARLAALAEPGRVYASVESVKRLLGADRAVTVLDARGRSATYRPQEVASFLVKALIEQAETESLDGKRVRRVVATYPTLWSPRRRRALQDAVLLALRSIDEALVPAALLAPGERSPELQRQADELVELRLDEANAAAFRLITGPLLESNLRFGREQEADVLAIDVGGGTTDVAYLRVGIRRLASERQTRIEARLMGVTGDLHWGGDNVSLELLKLLRARLVVAAAKAIAAQAQADAKAARAAEGLDIFDRILAGSGEAPPAWSGERAAGDGEEPDDLTPPPLERRIAWARLVAEHGDAIIQAAAQGGGTHPLCDEGKDAFLEHLRDLLRADAAEKGKAYRPELAEQLDEAIERLLPTRFARHGGLDPVAERRAKLLFMDLWREANDRLKPLLVARCADPLSAAAADAAKARVQEPLERAARWLGLDPKVWTGQVEVSLGELERMVEVRARGVLHRARDLYLGAALEPTPASVLPAPFEEDDDPVPPMSSQLRPRGAPRAKGKLTILLTGNASILPLIRRELATEFEGIEHELVWDERTRKSSVAQGAVEERLLAREFGAEGGGVHYTSVDFLERLPRSIGLWSRFLGFKPLFRRGAREGDVALVTARDNELVKRDLEDLSLYADHHDGGQVRWLGAFDFARPGRPADVDDLEPIPVPEPDPRTGRPIYQALFRLGHDWTVELIDAERGMVYRMAPEEPQLDPRDDPFSGVN